MSKRKFGRLFSAAAVLTLGGVGYKAVHRSSNPYYHGPVTDNFDGVRFFVPGRQADKGPLELLRWQLAGGREDWPATFPSPYQDHPPERVEGLRVALVGHASVLIQVAGLNILVDPIWSERASPFQRLGPKRVNPPGIAFDDLPPIDAVLITHNHYDHLDVETVSRLWHRYAPRVVAPLGNDSIVQAHDPAVKVTTRDWDGQVQLSEAVSIRLVPAYHWSARSTNDRRMALWCGYVLTTPSGPIYLAGDTAYWEGALFRDVRERFGAPRLAILPIGAYEPRWFMETQHMNPADAVKALQDCGAEQALGYHWGTFRLTNEGVDQPERDLAVALDEAGVPHERFRALRPGEVWEPGAADPA